MKMDVIMPPAIIVFPWARYNYLHNIDRLQFIGTE